MIVRRPAVAPWLTGLVAVSVVGAGLVLPVVTLPGAADVSGRLNTPTYPPAIDNYVEQEVHPYVPDAWIDHTKTKIGYEIPLTRHFYVYTPPRPLEEIDAEIKQLEQEIQELLREVTE